MFGLEILLAGAAEKWFKLKASGKMITIEEHNGKYQIWENDSGWWDSQRELFTDKLFDSYEAAFSWLEKNHPKEADEEEIEGNMEWLEKCLHNDLSAIPQPEN